MADAVSDAAQTSMPQSRQSDHNEHAYSGAHGDRPSPATPANGDSTARSDKCKKPKHMPQAMGNDEPSTTPAEANTGLIFPSTHGCQSSDYGVSPEQRCQMMASLEKLEQEDWAAIEENWNVQKAGLYKKEDETLLKSYQAEEDVLADQLEKAIAAHNRVLQDLFQARVEVDGKVDDLQCLLAKYQDLQRSMEKGRDATDLRVRSWIGKGRKAVAEAAARRQAFYDFPLADDNDDRPTSIFNERLHGLVEHSAQNHNSRSYGKKTKTRVAKAGRR